MPAPLAGFATVAFCAFLALFPAASGWLQARVPAPDAARACLLIPAAWVLFEWLLVWIFTGFPWLALGYTAAGWPLQGYAPLGGVYALSFITVSVAGMLWLIVQRRPRFSAGSDSRDRGRRGLAPCGVEHAGGRAGRRRAAAGKHRAGDEVPPRALRAHPGDLRAARRRHRRAPDRVPGDRAAEVLSPDRPRPTLRASRPRRSATAAISSSAFPTSAAPRRTTTACSRSASRRGRPTTRCTSCRSANSSRSASAGCCAGSSIPLSDFSRGAADQPPLARRRPARRGQHLLRGRLRRRDRAPRCPRRRCSSTSRNVAWFGDSLAPAQHLQIARLRAIETGRMHLTATNTGITAAIDRDGRVLKRLAQFSRGPPRDRGAGIRGRDAVRAPARLADRSPFTGDPRVRGYSPPASPARIRAC